MTRPERLQREGGARFGDPERWLVGICGLVIGFSCLQVLLFAFGRDQSIYATVADGLLHGLMPYKDRWDFKPPGIFGVYALAQALFGRSMWAPRLLEVLGLLGVVYAYRALGARLFGGTLAGWFAAALAALLYAELEFWHSGQPETFGGFLTVAALWLCTGSFSGRWRWLCCLAIGLLFGAAFLLKPPLGGGALVVAVYLARREYALGKHWLTALAVPCLIGIASLLPLLGCYSWFKLAGAWAEARWTLFEFTPGYTQLGWASSSPLEMLYWGAEEAFFRFSALFPLGLGALLALPPSSGREREGLGLVGGLVAMQLAGIALQGKFFQYHYAATLPLIALLAGVGLAKLWQRSRARGFGAVALFAALVMLAVLMRSAVRDLPGTFWQRSARRLDYALSLGTATSRAELDRALYYVADYNLAADRDVAAEVARRTQPDDAIYVWGFEPAIYWLAERRPASRFIYNVAQRARWQREVSRTALAHDLTQTAPALVVVQHNDVFPAVTGDALDSDAALEDFPWLSEWLTAGYEQVDRIEDFDVYAKKAPASP